MPGPHCKAPTACKASRKATHCQSCESSRRMLDPARRAAVREVALRVLVANRSPFRGDEVRARRAVLLASAFGLAKAARMIGTHPSNIIRWRNKIERLNGKPIERLPRETRLTEAKAVEILRMVRAGEKHTYIAALFEVHPASVSRINRGLMYPQAREILDLETWNKIGAAA